MTGGAEATADTVDFILEEMGRFCEQELAPLNTTGDEEGCTCVVLCTCCVRARCRERDASPLTSTPWVVASGTWTHTQ